jgi:peptidoglycan/xylan/chitin deacetylase (PgdA/CDA1 family)
MKKALIIIYLLSFSVIFAGCAGKGFVLGRMEASLAASHQTAVVSANISQAQGSYLTAGQVSYIEEIAAVTEPRPLQPDNSAYFVQILQAEIFRELTNLTRLPFERDIVDRAMIEANMIVADAAPDYTEEINQNIAGHIAITFDDGPHHTLTPILLDALYARNIKATFFLLGFEVDRNPEIVARMYREGHSIGNHSYRHSRFPFIGRQRVIDEIEATNNSIKAATGSVPTLLRPPYGEYNSVVLDVAHQMDMSVVMWSVDPRDWDHRNALIVRDNILNSAADGSVVLLHDIHESSIEAAIMAIDALIERGYVFVTVEELFALNELTLQAGQVYRSVYHSIRVSQ